MEWEEIIKTNDMTLLPLATAVGGGGLEATFPGKKAEPMAYIGGIDNHEEQRRVTTSIDGWKRGSKSWTRMTKVLCLTLR